MKCIRIDRRRARRERPWREVLPPDPETQMSSRSRRLPAPLSRVSRRPASDQIDERTAQAPRARPAAAFCGERGKRCGAVPAPSGDFNSEQIDHWECFHQAGRTLVTPEGPLAGVPTLAATGWPAATARPGRNGLMGPSSGKANLSPTRERRDRAVATSRFPPPV